MHFENVYDFWRHPAIRMNRIAHQWNSSLSALSWYEKNNHVNKNSTFDLYHDTQSMSVTREQFARLDLRVRYDFRIKETNLVYSNRNR